MRLYTPESLLYPITVTKLLRQPGDNIDVNEPLFVYEYKSTVPVWDKWKRDHVDQERTWPSTFESELEGSLSSLNVSVGQVLTRRSMVADVEEPCKHEVQFGGLCASCGKDMSEVNTYNESTARTQRATINTVHDRTELLVSAEEATRADEEAKRRLLDSKRLSLVVDLDQTIIHASVEPTIAEWQSDPSNPNHEAVKDVCKFQLLDDKTSRSSTWYYIKLRPGLREFLKTMSEYYEMHIYTMGTRTYAQNISKIIDPDGQIFSTRILSRDESGSMSAKSLKRLFPVDTKMVVIIDDRADVWQWIPNLIKVNVYEFFVGIGDINSSFLPKRPELEAKPKPAKMEREPSSSEKDASSNDDEPTDGPVTPSPPPPTAPQTNGDVSTVDKLLSMAASQDEKSMKTKEEEQEQTITSQLEDRPLLQKQKMLDALEEEEAKTSPAVEAAAELLAEDGEKKEAPPTDSPLKPKYRHNLLQDDDTELKYLAQHLVKIHEVYYSQYDKELTGIKGSRVAELRPGSTKKRSVDEFEHIPDAANVVNNLKAKVLEGVSIVFSGVVPLGVNIQSHDTAVWAKSFGATVSENITKKTTHVIASPERRTAKVRQAAKKGGRIYIVGREWLFACFSEWKKVDEDPYRIHSDAPTKGDGGLPNSFGDKDLNLSSSDEEAAETEEEGEGEGEDEPANASEIPNGSSSPRGLSLSTTISTDSEEWEKHKPTIEREDSSPTAGESPVDWGAVDGEFEEFMGSLSDDTDTDSVGGNDTEPESEDGTKTPPSQRKRKLSDRESGDEEMNGGSKLQKRKRNALERTSSLTNIATVTSKGKDVDEEGGGNETDGDDLEAALAAEMERQSEEDEPLGNGAA